jgi:predicted nuclease of restriction endonuclease-like RecB superfamily
VIGRDLLRFKRTGNRIEPRLLKATPSVRDLAANLLAHWRDGMDQRRDGLEDGVTRIIHASRSQMVARGLDKLITDACRFDEAASAQGLRQEALAISAQLLAESRSPDPAAHRRQVAERMGMEPQDLSDRLYGDLPGHAWLRDAPGWTPVELIDRYNLGLTQGLLLGASRVECRLEGNDVGERRRLLKALRFQRLLALSCERDGALVLDVSGPGSVLDQSTRYGLQLAGFLPHLVSCSAWSLSAEVDLPKRQGKGDLVIDHTAGLKAESRFIAYQPEELRGLKDQLDTKLGDWQIRDDPQLLPLAGGELVAPDLRLERPDGRHWDIEFFHRWHRPALNRRLAQLADGTAPSLLLGIDRSLLKSQPELDDNPIVVERSFPYSGFPTATALLRLLKRQG